MTTHEQTSDDKPASPGIHVPGSAPVCPITRAAAKAKGLKRYFTGRPCLHGHVAERYTVNGTCVECGREYDSAWYAAHREEKRTYKAARHAAHREEKKAYDAAYRAAHCDEIRTYRDAHRNEKKACDAAYRAAHPEKVCAQAAKRRAAKLSQRCACCTDAQIEEFYLQTALYSGHVDHIVPLALGGQHCVKNLQAMTDVGHRLKTKADIRLIAAARRDATSQVAA